MATREEVIATLKAKGYNGPIPDENVQTQPVNPIQNALKNVLGGAYAGFTGTALPSNDLKRDPVSDYAQKLNLLHAAGPTPTSEAYIGQGKANRRARLVAQGYVEVPEGQELPEGSTTIDLGEGEKYVYSPEIVEKQGEASKLKKAIPEEARQATSDIGTVIANLGSLHSRASEKTPEGEYKFKTGPMSFRYTPEDIPLGIGQRYASAVSTPEETQFTADLTATQAAYAKAESGVQRGFKEIQFLTSAMPRGTLAPEKLIAVAESAIGRQLINMDNVVKSLENAGYDASEFRSQLDTYKNQYTSLVERATKETSSTTQQNSTGKYKIVSVE